MRHTVLNLAVVVAAFLFLSGTAIGAERSGFGLSVLVGEAPAAEYFANGTTYVEALRGAEYSLRITNPTPFRVAVALSVDGLNTIDAKHTDSRKAAKWVLDPYESTVITGWQVSDDAARRFFFTGEKHSYGKFLGKTENLGVIEAVFFREVPRYGYVPLTVQRPESSARGQAPAPSAAESSTGAVSAPGVYESITPNAAKPSDEYAATGIGDRKRNEVERVHIDLEKMPAASIRIRYEFRPQLVALGVLPAHPTALDRREHAHGFGGGYCPEP